jgi:poly(A) polymerase
MRIAGDWIAAGHVQTVLAVLAAGGHQAFLVGGCVRNAIVGQPVSDVDIATDATPLRVTELAAQAGLSPVPTGIDHGTVTVIADGVPHEVTTFRRDVETDGRRAIVAFSDDLADDAARRDFTMNALYADAQGEVIDPLGGLPDLLAGRVRFVGDSEARIREDYLRILRFFRFYAWYGHPDEGPDQEGLAACAALASGLDGLSRERIGQETRKLLSAPDPAPSVAAMHTAGVLGRVLPGADSRALAALIHLEAGITPQWVRRLAVLGGTGEAAALRMSRQDERRLQALKDAVAGDNPPAALGYRLGPDLGRDACLARAALGAALPDGWKAAVASGAAAVFPLRAADLMPALEGRALGARLAELEERWIASEFKLTREQLLA